MAFRGVALWAALGGICLAQDPPAAPASATPAPASFTPRGQRRAATDAALNEPEMETVRKAVESLTPEQRQRFQQNIQRWMNLAPGEQRLLREREEVRRQRMADETERAIKESGLELKPEERVKFVRRYLEERRGLEEKLRREMEERRRPQVQEIITKLRDEFGEKK